MVLMVTKINPLNETQFERLTKSIDWSDRMLEKPKKERIMGIKQFIGYHHSEGGAEKRIITPLLKMAVDIHVRLLAARSPRALFSTKHRELKWTAANLELAVNQIPDEINFEVTLRRLVIEALFSIGVAKCGLYTVGNILGHEYGAPFVDVVTLDELIIDMAAKHLDLVQYIGNTYWMDFEDVMEEESFNNKDDLASDDFTVIGEAGEDVAQGITVGETAELFKKKIQLCDVWLPSDNLMVTYAVTTKRRLKTIEWEGPERGPYSVLGFGDVCGNLLPIAPVSGWRDLHELGNALYRKLGDQADSQKTALGFQGDDEGAEAFKVAKDGDGIKYTSSPPIKMTAGGIDPTTLAFFEECKSLFSYFGGNLDALGGLSPQSKTLGQDRLISEASSAQIREMAAHVVKFTTEIFRNLAYYEWHDPVRRRNLRKSIPGTDLEIIVPWNKESRRGKFVLYDLEIDVFSLQDNSPSAKLQRLMSMLKEIVFPLMPAIEQAGGILDVQALLEVAAKWQDIDELKDIVRFVEQPEMMSSSNSQASMQSTTRQVERINRPGATEAGKSQALQQVLLGGRPQGDEVAQIGRPTS